jgi:hypothetical protein
VYTDDSCVLHRNIECLISTRTRPLCITEVRGQIHTNSRGNGSRYILNLWESHLLCYRAVFSVEVVNCWRLYDIETSLSPWGKCGEPSRLLDIGSFISEELDTRVPSIIELY